MQRWNWKKINTKLILAFFYGKWNNLVLKSDSTLAQKYCNLLSFLSVINYGCAELHCSLIQSLTGNNILSEI